MRLLFLCAILLFKITFAQKASVQSFSTVSKIHIRALEVVSDKKVWFAANRGIWGYTEDAGKTWHIDSLKVDSIYPQFRSIAVYNDSTIFLLSIASPAYLFKTTNKGKTWRVVYKNTHPKAFFDSMIFPFIDSGYALGDPIDGRIMLIKTKDAGETWFEMNSERYPSLVEGEACFATSNTNLDCYTTLWFVTGGKRARLFYSLDGGYSFSIYDTPFPEGEAMTGIYSLDFYNDKIGAIAGGNYDKTSSDILSLAITNDGGKSWTKIKGEKPFFGSCVQFKNANEFFITGHDGTFKYNIKTKDLDELKDKDESLKFSTLRFSPSKRTMWMAGAGGKIVLVSSLK